jgi:hypothetical protein
MYTYIYSGTLKSEVTDWMLLDLVIIWQHQPLEAGTRGLVKDSRPRRPSACYSELETDCVK